MKFLGPSADCHRPVKNIFPKNKIIIKIINLELLLKYYGSINFYYILKLYHILHFLPPSPDDNFIFLRGEQLGDFFKIQKFFYRKWNN